MKNIKNLIYVLSCLTFTIIIGAAVYEHLCVIPKWSAGPPASLAMFQGEYGFNAGDFWSKIHPITLLLFIINLVMFWKSIRRNNILIPLVGYLIVIVITFTYFVPELMDITATEYAATIDQGLQSRAGLWENLSLLRLLFIIGLAIMLFLGLTKPDKMEVSV